MKKDKELIYNNDSDMKPVLLENNDDVKKMVSIIKELTGIVLYASDMDSLRTILNNPNEYLSSEEDVEIINELKFFLEFEGVNYAI
jgi:hypothetical protein